MARTRTHAAGRWVLGLGGAGLLCWWVAGCSDVDWNWDPGWWQEPTRIVRPTQPRRQVVRHVNPASSPSTVEREEPLPEPPLPEQSKGIASARPAVGQRSNVGNTPRSIATGPRQDQVHPFYQLYFSSGPIDQTEDHRGDRLVGLEQAGARGCACLLEMLYVPVGRSGGSEECYLLYEHEAEFAAAAEFAPLLDVAAPDEAVSIVGAEASLRAGIGLLLRIVDQGAMVDLEMVDRCEHYLAQATQSAQLSPMQQWAAGILAGRLVSEFRYDYPEARSYYGQAKRAARPGSLEEMTACWWEADGLAREGMTRESRTGYQTILAEYGKKWGESHIVSRARAILNRRSPR